ncbi:MAG: FAD-binding oxidoreductase [Candidatus Latescibacterota bacterium]
MTNVLILVVVVAVGAVVGSALRWVVSRRRPQAAIDFAYDPSDGPRFAHRWGYTDTRFEFDGPRAVRVTGSRYPLSGYRMTEFIPFAEGVLGVPIAPQEAAPEVRDRVIPEPRLHAAFLAGLRACLAGGQMSTDPEERLAHSHGQLSVDEVYRVLYVDSLDRLVDLVVYPQGEEDVRAVVHLAHEHDVCLIPYGGGTNVSAALTCPAAEERTIVSVDMRRMNRILWLDEANLQAGVEAGITGKELERQLQARGYTCGHDPDSVELSTLGGWISTSASGMKKNRYGNIEEIVLEATLLTPTGEIEVRHATPRNSTGVQPRGWMFGSEGSFGIITRAVIKVHPQPEVRDYGSLVFRTFAQGVAFLKELRQRQGVVPASIRLLNNFEFRFGQALKPQPGAWQGLVAGLQKLLLLRVLRFDPLQMVACTLLMEGTRAEVKHQRKVVFATARRYGGISAGAGNGKRGYTLTFGIAYIRDFFNQFRVLGETFETSVPWDRILPLTEAVERELREQCRPRGVQGTPYLSYRVTQTYQTGVCVYFTMGFSGKGLVNPTQTYHEIEGRLRQVILDQGGSLSHHHGIGKIRQRFLPQVHSLNAIAVLRRAKEAMDPRNVFGARNGPFADLP